jgi:hypothetical protein
MYMGLVSPFVQGGEAFLFALFLQEAAECGEAGIQGEK